MLIHLHWITVLCGLSEQHHYNIFKCKHCPHRQVSKQNQRKFHHSFDVLHYFVWRATREIEQQFSKGYFFNWHVCNGDRERCLWRVASFSYSSHLWPPHALWIVILKRTTPIRTEMLDHRLKVRIYNNFILICSCSASQTVWCVTVVVNSITAGGEKI